MRFICFAVEGFLERKSDWTRKKKKSIVILSLSFECSQFIKSASKAKCYWHSSGPGPTIFSAQMHVFSSDCGMVFFRVFLVVCFFISVVFLPFGNR